MEDLEKIEELLNSFNDDNILIALYIAENLLNKKDLVTLYYDNSYYIKNLIGNFRYTKNKHFLEKAFLENNPSLKYARLFMQNLEIDEEDIKNWIYSASLKNKYKGSDGNYYWSFPKRVDYHELCISYLKNNNYDFKRTDILTLASVCNLTEISYLIKDKELKDSDYYYIFTKSPFYFKDNLEIDIEMFFYKVLNYAINNRIIKEDVWYKLFSYIIKFLKTLKIEDFFDYLKYSTISRKHLNIIKKYYSKYIINTDDKYYKYKINIKNGITYKKEITNKKVIWEEVRTQEKTKLKRLGIPKRYDTYYSCYVYSN